MNQEKPEIAIPPDICFNGYIPEVCAGLRFLSRQGVEISARLPARLPGNFKTLVQAWSRDKNLLSSPGPGAGHYYLVPACPSRQEIRRYGEVLIKIMYYLHLGAKTL